MNINVINVLSILLMLCVIPTVWLVYKKKIKFFSGVFLGTFLFLMSFVCSMYCIRIEYGYSPYDIFADNAQRMIYAYSTTPGITAEKLQIFKSAIAQMQHFYTTLFPSLLVITNLFMVYIIFMISKGVLTLLKKDVSGFEKFCNLKMPRMAIVLSVLCYILSNVLEDTQAGYAFLNFTAIIYNVCIVCGLSLIDYAIRKKVKFSLARLVIYIGMFLIFGNFLATVLPFAGMADGFLNFRKIGTKSENE